MTKLSKLRAGAEKFPDNAPPTKIIDYWSANHFSVGMIYAFLGIPQIGNIALKSAFEWVENPMKRHMPFLFPDPSPDDFKAQVLDVGFGMLGWEFFHWMKKKWSTKAANQITIVSAVFSVAIYLASFHLK